MSTEPENPKARGSRGDRRGRAPWWRRWRSRVRLPRPLSRAAFWLYELCFPFSERSHGYYGYGGVSRQNRVKWLWRRWRRRVRKSFIGSASRAARNRWDDWWYPVSGREHSYSYGGARQHRLVRDWHRLKRRAGRSFVGHGYAALKIRFYAWWYPPSTKPSSYPAYGYGHQQRNRLELAWHNARRRLHSSWLGRKYRLLAGRFYEWYFPLAENSDGYISYRRVSRPVRLARRCIRWFRHTWLGRKTGWVLDEADDLILQVRLRAAQDFAWRNIQQRLKRWQTWAMLVCLATAIVFGCKYGLPRYRHYLERTYALQAQSYAAKGDFPRAILRSRQLSSLNPDNQAAIRVFADVSDYFGSPNALYWRQRLVALNPDPTNRLALARTALRAEAFPFPTAAKALNEIAPANRQSPAYQLVAGALAVKLNDLPAAEQHYEEALKLNPDDPVNRMSLAVVRLQSGNPRLITDSRTTLELLSTDHQLGLLASRSLVAEAIARRDFARAERLSDQILTNRQVSFSDRIVHLAILNVEKSPRFKSFLGETEKSAEDNPFYVGELASWMNRFGQAQTSLDWLNGLPAQLNRQGLVPIAVADAYAALGKWKELAAYLEKARWAEMDAVRIGMMALASREEFGDVQYAIPWQQATLLAARSPAMLNTLAQMSAGWGWKQETEDVLWFAAGQYPAQGWPLADLEKLYTQRRDTAGLRRVFQAMVKENPKDAQAQNNFAMVSLLLGVDVVAASQTVAELHAAQPDNPVFASTYAFSLYLQNRPQEAAQTLRTLGLNRLDDPSLAAYYGVFLAAAGDKQTARIYLDKSAKAFLLPEEQALVARAKQAM